MKLHVDKGLNHRGYMLSLFGGIIGLGIILLVRNGAHIQLTMSLFSLHLDLSVGINEVPKGVRGGGDTAG